MKNSNKPTRSNKFGKNRSIAKVVTLIISITIVLMLLIFGIWLVGGGENNASNESMQKLSSTIESSSFSQEEESAQKSSSSIIESKGKESTESKEEKVKTEEVKPSDDNVTSAIKGNWKPLETTQEGTHVTNYNNGSEDRKEIKQANANATGLAADDMIEWRVENDGDQKVVATVSDSQQTKTYRVYLTWVDNQGWQPTKVEVLKENDQR